MLYYSTRAEFRKKIQIKSLSKRFIQFIVSYHNLFPKIFPHYHCANTIVPNAHLISHWRPDDPNSSKVEKKKIAKFDIYSKNLIEGKKERTKLETRGG